MRQQEIPSLQASEIDQEYEHAEYTDVGRDDQSACQSEKRTQARRDHDKRRQYTVHMIDGWLTISRLK